ncbi:MAG: glutamine synthetase family protein [Granulosicoccus sp.]|nr:glutamine synthetase family protein [Granulosicoccus sp.]
MKNRLRPMFCDHLSVMRGKILPESRIGTGATRFAQPNYAVQFDKDLIVDAPGTRCLEGLPDMELRWQESDIRDGWQAATKVVIGDLFEQDGSPLALDGRYVLKQAVTAWEARGLQPRIGIELECYAFVKNDDGQLVPYDTPGAVVYGIGPFNDPLGFTDAIWEMAENMGFSLDLMTSEYDTPQFEFTLSFTDAIAAVDDIVLFRQMAREVAFAHGVILTFGPKPIPEAGGNGMHINLSFVDGEGDNALANGPAGGIENMNDLARSCVAGWMKHHKGMAALVAPTVLSYQRLQPASMSGYWCNWGGDHRGVTTRVSTQGGDKARLEHRMADASANPYAAVATVLQAALLGTEGGYDLPEAESGDCFIANDAEFGTAENLGAALDDLAADTPLSAAVGTLFCEHLIHMKRNEIEKTVSLEGDALRDWYIWFV